MKSREHGLSLVVALIMLLIMTVTTLTLFKMSNTGSQIVGNMQFRSEALAASDATLQEVVSTTRMFELPNSVFLEPGCSSGSYNQRCIDLNDDGEPDLQVDVVPPECIQVTIIPNIALDLTNPQERSCAEGVRQSFGVVGSAEGNSLCADTTWNVRADAGDVGGSGITGARVSVVQGVGVLVRRGIALSFCFGPAGP
jgi:hypothetical protein